MLRVKYLHLCDYAFVTKDDKVSLIGIFDQMWSTKFPLIAKPFHVVGVVESEVEIETELKLEVLNPDGEKIFEGGGPLKLGAKGKFNFLLGINNFKFEKPGTYTMRLLEKENELTRTDLPILMQVSGQSVSKPRKV